MIRFVVPILVVSLLTALPARAERPTIPMGGDEVLIIPDMPVTSDTQIKTGLRSMFPTDASVIMSFTYANCDSMCDVTNAILLDVDQRLTKAGPDDLRIVTISIDPENDTPDVLAAMRAELEASNRWLMVTGGLRGTRPLLEALRFPAGPIETHELMFLVGRPCSGRMTRVVSFADPEMLIELAAALPECRG